MILSTILVLILGASVGPDNGQETLVGVAANFAVPARELADEFFQATGSRVILVSGSTGKIYAQISNGAPLAAFLAADEEKPALLEEKGAALPGTRFTYAVGRLVLWSSRNDLVDPEAEVLKEEGFRHLAVANPRLAPYGLAAQRVLESRGLWQVLQPRLVRGENIGQTFQFVFSGNAELGFVALSQYLGLDPARRGSVWLVPESLHAPILQQAVLLKDDPVARAFLEFLKSPAAREIIRDHGYGFPDEAMALEPEVR